MVDLQHIAGLLGAQLQGDGSLAVRGIQTPERAGKEEIAFLAKGRALPPQVQAGALIVHRDSPVLYPNLLRVDDPYLAFARVLELFHPRKRFNEGVHAMAWVAPTAQLGEGVSVGPFSVVGDGAVIGAGSEIHNGVSVYPGARIGRGCLIYANVVIREGVEIGDEVIIQPGAVIGADGFGFTRQGGTVPVKIPQVGRVKIGDRCEIGANTCIDRSTLEETVLAEGVKLDNLVQIGHNVSIGSRTCISAQTGISGSTRVGADVVMGGQVGVADHVSIADGVMVAAQSGISNTIKERGIFSGSPHQEIGQWRRAQVLLRRLPELRERIVNLESRIEKLEES